MPSLRLLNGVASLPPSEPLRLALDGLREWFETNLAKQGSSTADLERADLLISFRKGGDDYDSAVATTLVDRTGKSHVAKVTFILPTP
jgi:hypothetical protein